MTRRPRQSLNLQGELVSDIADDVDAVLLHNALYDDLDQDAELGRLCDAVAAAQEAQDLREDHVTPIAPDMDRAVSALHGEARDRAQEAAAQTCVTIIDEADDWTDHYSQAKIDAAKHEAREWLQTASPATLERAGVLEVLDQ